jgi:hypothetical protein
MPFRYGLGVEDGLLKAVAWAGGKVIRIKICSGLCPVPVLFDIVKRRFVRTPC